MSTPHYSDEWVTLHHGDCLDVLRTLPDASVDSVVTDPPYGLEFMGKDWDKFGAARSPSTASRAGAGAVTGGNGITRLGYDDGGKRINRPSFGGTRPKTWRCDACGKRDQFRNAHDGHEGWTQEVIDPAAPAPLAGFQAWCELWARECLRVLKPGGHLLAFGGTRTSHRLACAIEDAGFEIRDSIAWLYGSGFPKSLDVSKAIDRAAGAERKVVGRAAGAANGSVVGLGSGRSMASEYDETAPATPEAERWQGWGTAMKPAHEPVVVARKPLIGTVAANILAHGTGALNVDGCRVEGAGAGEGRTRHGGGIPGNGSSFELPDSNGAMPAGRWPANVVLDEHQAAALDEQSGELVSGKMMPTRPQGGNRSVYGQDAAAGYETMETYGDIGGASRYFYTAKAGSDERPTHGGTSHPTVKPLALMRWLVRLVTPPDGTVLEPFAGSGTTAEACLLERFHCIAIEREADYLPLIVQRITRRRDPIAYLTDAGHDLGLFAEDETA